MEILYTEITQDLTEGLLEISLEELGKNRKVYYIVPSSMSFDKEKEILERLAKGSDAAVFDLLVTRSPLLSLKLSHIQCLRTTLI